LLASWSLVAGVSFVISWVISRIPGLRKIIGL